MTVLIVFVAVTRLGQRHGNLEAVFGCRLSVNDLLSGLDVTAGSWLDSDVCQEVLV